MLERAQTLLFVSPEHCLSDKQEKKPGQTARPPHPILKFKQFKENLITELQAVSDCKIHSIEILHQR